MRPLFAIVPLVALLSWLGEPSGSDPALSGMEAATAPSPARVTTPLLNASTLSPTQSGPGPALNGGQIMPVSWTAGR
ncbi:MAG: hypothetical protein ACK4K3_05680 [Aquabacterium sp.]